MTRLVLRVRRGGRLIGSWSIGEEPLEFSVVDVMTGKELATFAASGAGEGLDEVPIGKPRRLAGDDLTMPLPEPTELGEARPTEKIEIPVAAAEPRPAVAPAPPPEGLAGIDLSGRITPARYEGDDFTVPLPESTSGTHPLGAGLDEVASPTGDARPETTVGGLLEPVGPLEETTVGGREITLGEPLDDAGSGGEVQPVEVWVRRRDEWQPAGQIVPGQRVLNLGGWVRLAEDGRVVVFPGPRLDGSATLVDGRTVGIRPGEEAVVLPPGASVVLRHGDAGLYIRSEPVLDSPPSGRTPVTMLRPRR